jgi:hypothetical protein
MSEDQRKGFELRGWHVIVGLLAVLVVMFILFRVFGHSSLERKIAELRAKGYPTSYEELEKYNQLPEGVPNAADIYAKSFDAYRAPFENEKKWLPYLGSAELVTGDPNLPQMERTIEVFLSRNSEALDLLHQAGQVGQCRYDYPLPGSINYTMPQLLEIKLSSQLVRIRILSHAIFRRIRF